MGCHVLCMGIAFLCGSTLVKVPLLQEAVSRYDLRCFKATLNPNNIYKPSLVRSPLLHQKSEISIGLSSVLEIPTNMYRQNPAQGPKFYDLANLFSQSYLQDNQRILLMVGYIGPIYTMFLNVIIGISYPCASPRIPVSSLSKFDRIKDI